MAEAAKLTDNLCLLRHGPGPVWTVVFTREELQAIVNAIRKLLDPQSPLLEQLFTRTGFCESEFSDFAQQIVAVLDRTQDPSATGAQGLGAQTAVSPARTRR